VKNRPLLRQDAIYVVNNRVLLEQEAYFVANNPQLPGTE
jgi:hypothetical protein